MLYLATASSPDTIQAMSDGRLGQMLTPNTGNRLVPGATWAADNGCFTANWSETKWLRFLIRYADTPGCLFAVVPDVVGDAAATDARWLEYAPVVRALGYRCAYVTQNGCTQIPEDADVVFTGGDDPWKEGDTNRALIRKAVAAGIPCHMGRVNTRRRLRIAAADGYTSVDGTTLKHGADRNLPQLLRWLEPTQPGFWGIA